MATSYIIRQNHVILALGMIGLQDFRIPEKSAHLDDLVTQRYTLDQINEAVEALSAGRIHGRSIIVYDQ